MAVKKASTKTAGAVDKGAAEQITAIVSDSLRLARPFLVAGGLPVAGVISHHLWGAPGVLPWALTGETGSTVLLTWLSWRVTHDRGQQTPQVSVAARSVESGTTRRERRLARRRARNRRGLLRRVHLVVNTAGSLMWLELATATGVFTHPTADLWLFGAFTGGLAWILRHHVHTGGGEGDADTWGGLWRREIAEKAKLGGSQWRTIEADGPRIEATLRLAPGEHTAKDVEDAREHIAQAFDVPTRAVRSRASMDSARDVHLTVVAGDLLAKTLPWPGPSAPGGSVLAPIIIGKYEDWQDAAIVFPHAPAPVTAGGGGDADKIAFHLLIAGMTGSGKSAVGRDIVAELITRIDVVLWIADIVKKEQTFGAAAPSLDWFATDRTAALAMLDALPRIIAERADYLGRAGFDNWEPGCGLPYLVALIEEAAALVGDSDSFVRAAEQARSVGISLITSIQRPSYRTMPIDARAQFAAALCHGVKEELDARFVLDDLVDQGANPHEWRAARPGYSYLTAPGVPEDRHTVPLRSFAMKRDQLAALAVEWAGRRPTLDGLSAAVAGDAYRDRHRYTTPLITDDDQAAAGWTPDATGIPDDVVAFGAGLAAKTRGEDPDAAMAAARRDLRGVVDGTVLAAHTDRPAGGPEDPAMPDPVFVPPTNPDPDLADLDVDADLTAGTGTGPDSDVIRFGEPATPEMPLEEARRVLDDAIAEHAARRQEFAPRDLRGVVLATGRNRDWLMRELRDRVRAGRLARLDDGAGNYRAHAA